MATTIKTTHTGVSYGGQLTVTPSYSSSTGRVTFSCNAKLYGSGSVATYYVTIESVTVNNGSIYSGGGYYAFVADTGGPSKICGNSLGTRSIVVTPNSSGVAKITIKFRTTLGSISSTSYNSGSCSYTVYTSCTAPSTISVSPSIIKQTQDITVTWSGANHGLNTTISKYKIYYKFGGAPTINSYDGTVESTTSPKTISISNATRNTTLHIKIVTIATNTSYNSSISSASATVKINNLPSVPTITPDKSVLPSTGGKVTFTTITAGTDADGQSYKVRYKTASGTPTTSNTTEISSGANFSLTATTTYYFYTYDGLEFSTDATAKTITINDKPTISTATASATKVKSTGDSVTFTLAGSAGSTGTLKFRYKTASGDPTTSNTLEITSGTSKTVTATTSYYFYAYDGYEFSDAKIVTITVVAKPGAPTLKSGSTSLTSGGSTIISNSSTGYSITATGTKVAYATTTSPVPAAGSSTTLTINANPGSSTTYYFWSFNEFGESSSYSSFTVTKNALPATPTVAADAGISIISSVNYVPQAGGSVTMKITSGANTTGNANTYIYYSTSSSTPAASSTNKIAVSGAQTKSLTVTIASGNADTTVTYYFWVYDGLNFSSSKAFILKRAKAPTSIIVDGVTINNSYANGATRLNKGYFAWYVTAFQAKHDGGIAGTMTFEVAIAKTSDCSIAGSTITGNLATMKTITSVAPNTLTTSFTYNVYNAINAKSWQPSLTDNYIGWRIKVTFNDGINPAISTWYVGSNLGTAEYYAVPRAPSISVGINFFNKSNTELVHSSTRTSDSIFFYKELYINYNKDSSMTGTPEATIKFGSTTYTATVTMISQSSAYNVLEKIKVTFNDTITVTAHTQVTLTLKLKHATSGSTMYKFCTIVGNIYRIRDLPTISTITVPTTTYKPYSPTSNSSYNIEITNSFTGATNVASLESQYFVPYAVSTASGFSFQIANSNSSATTLSGVSTKSTAITNSKWQFTIPTSATFFNWTNNVGSNKLWTTAQLYGNQTYKIRTVVKDYFGRTITGSYSPNGTFNFDYTPTVTFKILGNSSSSTESFTSYPSGKKLDYAQSIKVQFTMSYRSAYPKGAISIPIVINGSTKGTYVSTVALAGMTSASSTSTSFTTSAYKVGTLGKGKTSTSISCNGTFNTTTVSATSTDTGITNNNYPSQPWYNPVVNINSLNISNNEGVNKVKVNYTITTWQSGDGISFGSSTDNKNLYLIKTTTSLPSAIDMSNYHSVVTGTSNRNFSDNISVISLPAAETVTTSTEFNISTAITNLNEIQYLSLGGYMHDSNNWYIGTRGQWFISNVVYGRLQTPTVSLRQENLGVFANGSYLDSLATASKTHPGINSKGVIFVKANTNAGVIVFQNMTDTNSLVYDIQNGKAIFYERANTDTTTWTETRTMDLKNGIFK